MKSMGTLYEQGYRLHQRQGQPGPDHEMIARMSSWQEWARIWIGHWLSRPFHFLFNLIPHFHFGLSQLGCLI